MFSVVVRDAHRLCYAPTRSVGAMIGKLEQMRTLRVYILDEFHSDALRAAPRSARGLARDTRGAVRAPRLLARNRAALPQAGRRPPREAKGCADGAMVLSQDEIDGTAPASSALRRRLEC